MKKTLLNDSKLGHKILERLNQVQKLPKVGFLAGGAVANTIMKMEHGSEYPIHDLDVFRITRIGSIESKKMPHRFLELELNVNYRGRIFIGRNYSKAYTIAGSWRSDMLNFIDVEVGSHNRRKDHYGTILGAFDLNCCQVGIDLESEELIYLPGFESFLKKMQLEVNYPCTPYHTAIRMVNKAKELGCYCNYEEQMRYLSQIPLVLSGRHQHLPEYSRYFGQDYYDHYLKDRDEIDRHFEVVKEVVSNEENIELFTMIPRNSTIIEDLRDCEDVCSIKTVWGLLQGGKGPKDKNIRALGLSRLSRDLVIVNPRYAQCDWKEKHFREIEKFFEQHPFMLAIFCRLKLNIMEQLDAIRVINRMVKKVGLFVIGLLENASQLPENNIITEEWIQSLVDDYKARNSRILKEPEDLGDFECTRYFSELLTVEDLLGEGTEMHHCVGGYAGAVESGKSLIFHIEAGGGSSTLEIGKYGRNETDLNPHIRQHSAKWNKEPHWLHKMFADELLLHLREKWFSRQCDECDANGEELKSSESPGSSENSECLAVG